MEGLCRKNVPSTYHYKKRFSLWSIVGIVEGDGVGVDYLVISEEFGGSLSEGEDTFQWCKKTE